MTMSQPRDSLAPVTDGPHEPRSRRLSTAMEVLALLYQSTVHWNTIHHTQSKVSREVKAYLVCCMHSLTKYLEGALSKHIYAIQRILGCQTVHLDLRSLGLNGSL